MSDKLSDGPDHFWEWSRMVKLSPPRFGPMIRCKGTFNMRHFSLKRACVLVASTWLLASCGGGSVSTGGSDSPPCDLSMAYADGGTSGRRIDPVAQSIGRQFNDCALKRVQSLTVGICIAHAQSNELSAQLVMPDGSAQNLNIQNVGGTCPGLIGGQLFQSTLTSTSLQSLQGVSGNWSVRVTDNNPVTTSIGSLVGWSMRAEGLQ